MRIGETDIHADDFVSRASAVLVSHYHRDHLRGIKRKRPPKQVVCSPLTADLLEKVERFDPDRLYPLDIGESVEINDRGRVVRVTALDANHCPGSIMFYLESDGLRVLYTGDFRLNDVVRRSVKALPALDVLYMDATFDAPHYRFPSQKEAVEEVLELMRRRDGRTVYLAIYGIGKNQILEAAFREFGHAFYTPPDKRRVYETIGMGRLITPDRAATPFRAYARGYLEHYFQWTREFREGRPLIIVPTGWQDLRQTHDAYRYVAYSEHCDHAELQAFRRLVQAAQVVKIHG